MKALILGVGGQDGSYLVDILLEKGYEVHGLYRRSSVDNLWRIAATRERVTLHQGDLLDEGSIHRVLQEVKPDEIYHVADQDHVGFSHSCPGLAMSITCRSVAVVLEGVRIHCPAAKVFIPSSATIFGSLPAPQNEKTPFAPASPYAIAKVAALHLVRYYRERYGLFVCCGIMYNHESPRRGGNYLLQHIVRTIRSGAVLELSNLDVSVDIGYAREYMEAAWAMLNCSAPADDYVIGTGIQHSIGCLAKYALQRVGHPDWIIFDEETNIPKVTLVADHYKAYKTFGFDPQYDAIKMVDMLLENQF